MFVLDVCKMRKINMFVLEKALARQLNLSEMAEENKVISMIVGCYVPRKYV